MSPIYAPIALFVYNRPDHTAKTIEALRQNTIAKDSDLFIFCDGAKTDNDLEKTSAVKSVLDSTSGFKTITIKQSPINLGLANSIISGVTEIVEKFGKVIVLEDDLVTSPYFLQYMNDGLDLYENEDKVASIAGYMYPVKEDLPETFFLRGSECWSWATWKRSWKIFEKDGSKLLKELKEQNLTKEFDFNGSYHYTKILEEQISGANNSWAIRWYGATFLADKLTLFPKKSLVHNIGFDGSGTHCSGEGHNEKIYNSPINVRQIPIIEDRKSKKIISLFLKPRKTLSARVKRLLKKLKSLIKKIGV